MTSVQDEQISFIFFKCFENSADIRILKEYSAKHAETKAFFLTNTAQALEKLASEQSGILIFEVRTKDDVAAVIDILTKITPLLKANLIKAIGYSHIENDKIETLLRKKGCTDLLIPGLSVKGLTYKCDQWLKAIRVAKLKYNAKDTVALKSPSVKPTAASTAQRSNDVQIHWVNPIEQSSDFWIIPKKWTVKKNFNNYAFELIGLPPSQGVWKEKAGDIWMFELNPGGLAAKTYGLGSTWVFHGKKPEFSWETYTWLFSSENPKLECQSANTSSVRVQLGEEQKMFAAVNGPLEAQVTQIIKDILQVEVRFKSQNATKTANDVTFKSDDAKSAWNDSAGKDRGAASWSNGLGSKAASVDTGEADELLEKLKGIGLEVQLYDPILKSLSPLLFLDQFDQMLICQPTTPLDLKSERMFLRIKFRAEQKKHELVSEVKCLEVDSSIEPPILTLDVSKVPTGLLGDLLQTMQSRQETASKFISLAKGF